MKKFFALCLFAAAMLPSIARAEDEGTALLTSSYVLGPVHIDKKFISMTGPVLKQKVRLGPETPAGPLWVKGFRVDVVDDKGKKESSEYVCHSWLTLGKSEALDQKMLTISEGLDEMNFPPGYAIRVDNTADNAELLAQALNNNEKTDKHLSYKLTVSYLDDASAQKFHIHPLRTVSVAVMAKDANPNGSSDICVTQDAVGDPVPGMVGDGKRSVVHFDVPAGRHEYRSAIPKNGPFAGGGTIHYIKLHLHPYGESVALVDKTANKTLWEGHVKTGAGRALLTDVDFYSSSEGIKLDPSHDYEVTSVYNNTTGKVTDAMAVLRVYISDDDK